MLKRHKIMAQVFRILVTLMVLVISGCGDDCTISPPLPDCGIMRLPSGWAKINTHVHTTLSDGSKAPEEVIQWYKDYCYDAIAITDHFIRYNNPIEEPDFVVMSGMEYGRPHHTSLNNGEIEIYNHPTRGYSHKLGSILKAINTNIFEIYNGHDTMYETTFNENLWDALLEQGRQVYGLAADDAHFKCDSAPGRGFTVVRISELTQDSILNSLGSGDFYASNGVYLSEYNPEGIYTMDIDFTRTDATLCEFQLIESGQYRRGKVSCLNTEGHIINAWGQPIKRPNGP